MKTIKILVIAPSLKQEDGWGTVARNTVKGLQARGHDVVALLAEASDENLCPQSISLPPAMRLLTNPLTWAETAWAINKAVRKWKPDVIHMSVAPYALAMPIACFFTKLPPWVFVLLGTYTVQPLHVWYTRPLMRRVYKQATYVLACSDFTQTQALNAIEEKCGKRLREEVAQKTVRFRLGIEEPTSVPPHQSLDKKHILFVGGVKARKGVLELVKACAVLKNTIRTPFHLDIIGKFNNHSGYIQTMRAFITNNHLEHIVTLHGHTPREDVEAAYARADLFAMLSKPEGIHFEGFGVVFLEANIRGIPTLASSTSGTREAVKEGVSGFVVDPDNPQEIAERMQWVLVEKRIKSEDCIVWAREHSVDQQVATFEGVYENIT